MPRLRNRWWRLLVAVAVVGLLAAAAMPAAGTVRAKAPVGVWSGEGDQEGDYTVIAVAKGPEGAQPGFFVEKMVGGCDLTPGVVYGTAALDGDTLAIVGDLVCVNTGDVLVADIIIELTYDADDDTLLGPDYPGPFTRKCAGGAVTHVGTAAGEKIVGTSDNDVMDGRGGRDILVGRGGMDILCGGPGNDKLKGGPDVDVLLGGGGSDTLIGGGGWDFAVGGAGPDTIKGGGGTDFLLGEGKPDTIYGGKGPGDVADGGAGSDTCEAETETSCELDPA